MVAFGRAYLDRAHAAGYQSVDMTLWGEGLPYTNAAGHLAVVEALIDHAASLQDDDGGGDGGDVDHGGQHGQEPCKGKSGGTSWLGHTEYLAQQCEAAFAQWVTVTLRERTPVFDTRRGRRVAPETRVCVPATIEDGEQPVSGAGPGLMQTDHLTVLIRRSALAEALKHQSISIRPDQWSSVEIAGQRREVVSADEVANRSTYRLLLASGPKG